LRRASGGKDYHQEGKKLGLTNEWKKEGLTKIIILKIPGERSFGKNRLVSGPTQPVARYLRRRKAF